jgi:hypothetical protein
MKSKFQMKRKGLLHQLYGTEEFSVAVEGQEEVQVHWSGYLRQKTY